MAKEMQSVTINTMENELQSNALTCVNNAPQSTKKVGEKAAIKSINNIALKIRTERLGVNATVRLICENAAKGDIDAINTLCALCDIPYNMLFALTIDDVRKAVNEYYPYVMIKENGRKINVKAKSVYFSTPSQEEETQEKAKNRITKGFYPIEVTDYLTALTSAAKARAKKQRQIVIKENKVYKNNDFSTFADVDLDKIKDAMDRKTFNFSKVNVWHKHNVFGYYI